jgi:hypothetical protein
MYGRFLCSCNFLVNLKVVKNEKKFFLNPGFFYGTGNNGGSIQTTRKT